MAAIIQINIFILDRYDHYSWLDERFLFDLVLFFGVFPCNLFPVHRSFFYFGCLSFLPAEEWVVG